MSRFEGQTIATRGDELARAVLRVSPGLSPYRKFSEAQTLAHFSAESNALMGHWDAAALDLLAAANLGERARKAREEA